MTWINSCPIDNTQIEFFGISKKVTTETDPETGETIIERFRWQECPKSHWLRQDMLTGRTLEVLTVAPDKKFFPTSRETMKGE